MPTTRRCRSTVTYTTRRSKWQMNPLDLLGEAGEQRPGDTEAAVINKKGPVHGSDSTIAT
jgi:hypothetical protein